MSAEATSKAVQAKFSTVRKELNSVMIERGEEIDFTLTALIAQEHALLVGPPGVGKSMLLDAITDWCDGKRFSVLLNKFTSPEEVFGPVSLTGLKEDRYQRITAGKLPEADFAFIDESLALDTPIPTPDGWKTIGDIRPGEFVYGSDGKPVLVTNVTSVFTDHDCYRVTFRDGESVVADGGHNWYCKPTPNSPQTPWRVMSTRQMAEASRDFQVPVSEPVVKPDADLPIDPYILGLWLGNGNNFNGELYICNKYFTGTLDAVQKIHPEAKQGRELNGNTVISLAETGFRTGLRDLGLIQNKFLPAIYLSGSVQQRLSVLQGLMDTDGHSNECSTCVFSNTNEQIIDSVVEIVRSLGQVATKVLTKDERVGANGSHKPCWKVTFHGDKDLPCFRGRNVNFVERTWNKYHRIKSIELVRSVPVKCLTVDAEDHLFLAGKNFVVTHNCFKGSSAILNSMLKILNERQFDNGSAGMQKVPLKLCLGASNEWPGDGDQGKELNALFDRFLLRKAVKPIAGTDGRRRLLWGGDHKPKLSGKLSPAELQQANAEANALPWSETAKTSLETVLQELSSEGIRPGDRRQFKAVRIAQAYAWLMGADEVEPDHLEILSHVLWDDPIEQPLKCSQVISKVSNPLHFVINGFLVEAHNVKGDLKNPKDLAAASAALAKLEEIQSKLKAVKSDSQKMKDARKDVSRLIRDIRVAAMPPSKSNEEDE